MTESCRSVQKVSEHAFCASQSMSVYCVHKRARLPLTRMTSEPRTNILHVLYPVVYCNVM